MGCPRNLVFLLLWSAMLSGSARADIVKGSTRAEIIAELGKPTSVARLGDREILQYKAARFELVNGAVTDIKGYVPPPAAIRGSAPPTPAVTETPKAKDDPVELEPSALPAGVEFNPAIAANALGDEIATMETGYGPAPSTPERTSGWLESTLMGLLHFGFTLLALSVAFKYWEMDALWTGTLTIAAIDVVIYGLLTVLGPHTGGFTAMIGVQTSVLGAVMIFTIRHFCFNKDLQNAVLTAGVVKLVVMICNIFLSMALLNALFG